MNFKNQKIRNIVKKVFIQLPDSLKVFLILNFFYPKYFVIEPVNICNIKCVACPWHTTMKREKKSMTFEEFLVIFDKIKKHATHITFYQMGEPLLNKDLFKMIKKCVEYKIKTNISTNGMLINEYLDEILNSGLSDIKIALDGIDKETHERYRAGSNFDKIINNIKLLKSSRDDQNKNKPNIIIQTLVNKYNQNQLKEINDFAKKYADKFVCKKMHLGRNNELIQTNKHFETDIEEYKRENVKDEKMYFKNMQYCPQFNNLVVLSNGELVQCCFDYDAQTSFGNLLREPYKKILKSSDRKKFLQTYFKRTNLLCQKCDFIQDMLIFKF